MFERGVKMNDSIRSELIAKLTANLPVLRAKLKLSQAELSTAIGVGRQTIVAIESGNSKMRWDTFLAIVFVISLNEDSKEMMSALGVDCEMIGKTINRDISIPKLMPTVQEKVWTDCNFSGTTIRGFAPLPVGYRSCACPKCGSYNISGVMIMPEADEQDPNIICLDCGYWWD